MTSWLVFLQIVLAGCQATQPNIVFILADDLGWNDVGYHGSEIHTPNLDKLASDGVKLENYYVQPICSPTRSQLLSGRYQIHTGLQHSVITPEQPNGLPLEIPTLADKLRDVGYATHIVGKWHLGFYKKEYMPTNRGFDTHYGFLSGGEDHYTHVRCAPGCGKDLRDNMEVDWEENSTYSGHLFTARAQRVIKQHAAQEKKPLFLYLPYQLVHSPNEVPPEYEQKYAHIKNAGRRKHAGMTTCLDEGVANVTRTLKETGLWKNTILIFSTDNGGQTMSGGNNWPLRGRKDTLWEGGVRAVGLVTGPLIPAVRRGQTVTGLLHVTDWFPSLVGLAGGSTEGLKLDGYDNWDTISKGFDSKRKELLHNIDPVQAPVGKRLSEKTFDNRVRAAIRSGDWKLITGDPGEGKWWPPPKYMEKSQYLSLSDMNELNDNTVSFQQKSTKNIWLFDLAKDPEERTDLSDKYPEVVTLMLDKLAMYNTTAVPCRYPDSDPMANPKYHGGAWGPWQ